MFGMDNKLSFVALVCLLFAVVNCWLLIRLAGAHDLQRTTAALDDAAARRRAEDLVGVHRGCDTIEVWRGATRLFDVTSAQRAAA